jgi:AraC family transcriptional activator of tynA and feaB
VVAQYIKNRRLDLCAQVLRAASDDEKLAGIGYSWGFATIAIFQRRLSSVLASRRANTASAAANYFSAIYR